MNFIRRDPRTTDIVTVLRGIHARAYTANPGSVSVISGNGQTVTIEFLGAGKIRMSRTERESELGGIVFDILRKVGLSIAVTRARDC